MDMKKWAGKVKRTIKELGGRRKSINLAIVSANNHYAGFGLGTANIFRKMVGLPEATWSKDEDGKSYLHSGNDIQGPKQSTLSILLHNLLAITISFIACTTSRSCFADIRIRVLSTGMKVLVLLLALNLLCH